MLRGEKKILTHSYASSLSDWDCFRSDLNTFNSNFFCQCCVMLRHATTTVIQRNLRKKKKMKKQRIRCVKNIKFKLVETEILHVLVTLIYYAKEVRNIEMINPSMVRILIKVVAFCRHTRHTGIRCDRKNKLNKNE